jgi:hypothetical protein
MPGRAHFYVYTRFTAPPAFQIMPLSRDRPLEPIGWQTSQSAWVLGKNRPMKGTDYVVFAFMLGPRASWHGCQICGFLKTP